MRRAVLSALLALAPILGFGNAAPGQSQNSSPPPDATQSDASGSGGSSSQAPDPAKLAAPKESAGAKPAGSVPVDPSYVIGAQDVLGISVWGQEGFSKISYMVRPDGRITVPFVDEVTAAGLTPIELGREIAERLGKYMKDPIVSVSLLEPRSKRYYIQGEVLKPGAVDLIVPTTVMEGLSQAGGFKDFADQKHIVVLRGDKRLKFNYKDVLKGKNLKQNVYLEPGDIIVVK